MLVTVSVPDVVIGIVKILKFVCLFCFITKVKAEHKRLNFSDEIYCISYTLFYFKIKLVFYLNEKHHAVIFYNKYEQYLFLVNHIRLTALLLINQH